VKLLMQLADSLVEKGHTHAADIKSGVSVVDQRYKDFHARLDLYRVKLEGTLGVSHDSSSVSVVRTTFIISFNDNNNNIIYLFSVT